ncbi:MAG: transglycosylase domain-containing protein [Acidobacteriota bacterium]|nr:transglycosylase domain-containing protein [Acidobacteriota bacterium]
MTPTARRTLIGLGVTGLVGIPLLLASYLSLGLWFAPPWPVQATSGTVTPLAGEALWARAEGGTATDLNPFRPTNMAQLVVCLARAEGEDDRDLQAEAQAACRTRHMPAFGAVVYLSEQHVRDAGLAEPGFREGHARFVTTIWLARSWTKAELLATLAERGEFGLGFRGLEAAAQGYFGHSAAQLTLPQVAMVASLVGDAGPDPWCEPAEAAGRRHRILERMRDNQTITEQAFLAADRSELNLGTPPVAHLSCAR